MLYSSGFSNGFDSGFGGLTPSYALEVDWSGNGSFEVDTEDITSDTLNVECRRGRDYASQLTGRSSAGRLVAQLRNEDGKYSSFNSSSPIYGSILPGRRV